MNCCEFLCCNEPGIWTDEESGRVYCGAHLIYVTDDTDVKQKRRDFAEEYARDAAREGFEQ